jgi:hypothetical protein
MKIPTMNNIFNLAIRIIVIILTVFIIAVLFVGLFHTIWGIKEFLLTKSIGQSFNFSCHYRIVPEFCRLF